MLKSTFSCLGLNRTVSIDLFCLSFDFFFNCSSFCAKITPKLAQSFNVYKIHEYLSSRSTNARTCEAAAPALFFFHVDTSICFAGNLRGGAWCWLLCVTCMLVALVQPCRAAPEPGPGSLLTLIKWLHITAAFEC